MKTLFTNTKFWLAVFGLIQSVLLEYFKIPQTIWVAIDVLIGIIITTLTANEVVAAFRGLRQEVADLTKQIRLMKK